MSDPKPTHPNDEDQKHNRNEERPQRPEPDTLEGPGGRQAKGDEDAADKTTRRGER